MEEQIREDEDDRRNTENPGQDVLAHRYLLVKWWMEVRVIGGNASRGGRADKP